ncbi:MAG TPA: T9SS type A sorting domain-containing protein, partial [Saprospiraceae bacterium]
TITFKVDMNNYTENFDTVYLSGTFNNWSGNANPLADPEFDGIWEGSLELPNGLYEYKVTLDNWVSGQEEFIGTEECTKKDPSGQFTNRLLAVSEDRDVPQFCYNSCYACGEEVVLQFKLGFDGVTPSPDGVWLAGGGNFDVPGGKYEMHDDDGDGIYEITVPRARNFSSFYTFANGNCPDYSCKENLAGLECGDPDNFNDRFLPAVTENTEIGTCFGTCAIDALCTVGTQTLQNDESVFSLHGNPSSTGYSILYFGEDALDEKWVTMTNSLGQEIAHWRVASGVTTFNLPTNELRHGMYLVTVKVDNRFYTRKLVN